MGSKKPDIREFLKDSIAELLDMKVNDENAKDRGYTVKVRVVRGDRPARAILKCIVYHNGYNSCERCLTVGTTKGAGRKPSAAAVLQRKLARRGVFPNGKKVQFKPQAPKTKKAGEKPAEKGTIFPELDAPLRENKSWFAYMKETVIGGYVSFFF